MRRSLILPLSVAGIFLLALGGTLAFRHYTTTLTVQAAKTEQAIEQAKQYRVIANEAVDSANVARARAEAAEKRLVTQHAQTTTKAAQADKLASEAPDTCRPALDAMRAAREAAVQEAATATIAYQSEKEAAGKLRAALNASNAAADAVIPAAEKLAADSRRSIFAGLVPHIGVTAGIDRHLKPNVTVGATWSF